MRNSGFHGFEPPTPDGRTMAAQDCPECGLPTLVGETSMRTVRLDAMPVRVWQASPIYGASVSPVGGYGDAPPLYLEHVCPLGGFGL